MLSRGIRYHCYSSIKNDNLEKPYLLFWSNVKRLDTTKIPEFWSLEFRESIDWSFQTHVNSCFNDWFQWNLRPWSVDSLDGGFFTSSFHTVGRSKIKKWNKIFKMRIFFPCVKSFGICRSVGIKKIKQKFYSIGPKIGTSVALPSRKSTDHGLIKLRSFKSIGIIREL